jgi:hypothetical protein
MSLIEYFKKKFLHQHPEPENPKGYCPNCWGRQEYKGHFEDAVKTSNIHIGESDKHKGWIEEYAETYLSGIKLNHHHEHGEGYCPTCKMVHQ